MRAEEPECDVEASIAGGMKDYAVGLNVSEPPASDLHAGRWILSVLKCVGSDGCYDGMSNVKVLSKEQQAEDDG